MQMLALAANLEIHMEHLVLSQAIGDPLSLHGVRLDIAWNAAGDTWIDGFRGEAGDGWQERGSVRVRTRAWDDLETTNPGITQAITDLARSFGAPVTALVARPA